MITKYRDDPNPPLEEGPEWTKAVGPLSEHLCVVRGATQIRESENLTQTREDNRRPTHELGPFAKRNIYADFVQLYVVHSNGGIMDRIDDWSGSTYDLHRSVGKLHDTSDTMFFHILFIHISYLRIIQCWSGAIPSANLRLLQGPAVLLDQLV